MNSADSGDFPDWSEYENHRSGRAFFGHLAQIVRYSRYQAFVGEGIDIVEALVHDRVERLASFAVDPIGIDIDGTDFSWINTAQKEKGKGESGEQQ